MKKIFSKILLLIIHFAIRYYKKTNRGTYNARIWSNNELKKIADSFFGDIINVSAGSDSDKEHNFYRNYFPNKKSYTTSNYKEGSRNDDEIILDLEQDLPEDLLKKFDIVFTHTVLEHVYNTDKSIKNLCDLSKNVVITIVPFLQTYHHEEEFYYDYWRFSPLSLIKKFNSQGFKTVYISWNTDPLGDIYILHVASCKPECWQNLSSLNKKNANEFAPGLQRQRLHSKLNLKSDRVIIKFFGKFLEY